MVNSHTLPFQVAFNKQTLPQVKETSALSTACLTKRQKKSTRSNGGFGMECPRDMPREKVGGEGKLTGGEVKQVIMVARSGYLCQIG